MQPNEDNKTKNIWIDIDETICYYDQNQCQDLDYTKAIPDYRRIKIVNQLYDQGHRITMWTARGTKTGIDWYNVTKKQLENWCVKYHSLKMGKPAFDLLIDDKAITCLEQIKLFY